MKKQVVWISPLRLMMVSAPIGFVLAYPLIGLIWAINLVGPSPAKPTWMAFVILPIALSAAAIVMTGLAAVAYNALSAMGLRVSVEVEAIEGKALKPAHAPVGEPPGAEYYRF